LQIRFEQLKIYYFSGTGNARRVSDWIFDQAKSRGINPEINNIASVKARDVVIPAGALIGIVSPTHGFNFPPLVMKFIFRFPKANDNNAVFMINTRAGMKMSKIFLPGLSGIAQLLAALVLMVKGYRIIGMRPIDLPSNWISLHPGLRNVVVNSIFERRKIQSIRFINKILDGKRNYRSLFDIIQDLLISPIAVGYYFVGRFMLAKTFYASRSCDNCGLCIKQCPVKAIRLVQNRPFWSYRCESCMRCMNNCPLRAIETAHGFIFVVLYLFYGLILTALYALLARFSITFVTGDTFWESLAGFIFRAVLIFIMLVVSYRMVHYLRQFKFFDYLIYYTSLTRFKFWRRYSAIKKPDFLK
jgi:ferredoxin